MRIVRPDARCGIDEPKDAEEVLHALGKSLAVELASRGITFNGIASGIVVTEMSEGAFDAEKSIQKMVPMQLAGTPACDARPGRLIRACGSAGDPERIRRKC